MNNTHDDQFDHNSSAHWTDFSAGYAVSHGERPFVPKPGSWIGKWIWLSESMFLDRQMCRGSLFCTDDFPHTVALFRKVFYIPFEPHRATVWISGDTKYRCWINGHHIANGPAEVGGDYGNREAPDWWFYEGVEVVEPLHRGGNVMAAEVVLGPQVQADYSMGHGGFLLEFLIEGENGEKLIVSTDDSWRATLSKAEMQTGVYDARNEISGWKTLEYEDDEWPLVDVIEPVETSRWNLLPREIPMLAEARIPPNNILFPSRSTEARFIPPQKSDKQFPLLLRPGSPIVFWLQFPCELTGQIYLDVEGASGTRLDIDFQETIAVPGKKESYILPEHPWSYQSRRLQGFEFIQITVTFPGGMQCQKPLVFRTLEAVFTAFPVTYRGYFESSDPFLNQLWHVGRWTTQLCMQSYHLDSPIHQEGLGCTGDYMIEALISYCCFGETRLARKDILRTAYLLKQKQGRMFHTSYSLLWVWMVRDYWLYTGDTHTVAQVILVLHKLLDLFDSYVGEYGLITEAPNYMFMDWATVGGYNLHHPPASMGQGYMNAFYFRALLYAAEMSRLCEDTDRVKVYEYRAQALKQAFNEHLWCPEHQLYRDGIPGTSKVAPNKWLPVDGKDDSFTVHTNAAAVAVGIAAPDVGQAIMGRVLADETLPMVQPYYMHFVFEALVHVNLFETYAFDIMERWKALLEEHPTSLKEMWDHGDYSHAWGGSPTYQLSTHVLGIVIRESGFRSVFLEPQLGLIHTVKGIFPTQHGPIEVAWKRKNGSLKGVLTGPSGIDIYMEADRTPYRDITITQDRRPIDGLRTTSESLCWTLNDGEYCIDIITAPNTQADTD